MRISKVKLDNYVCFFQVPQFDLGAGVNFVLGKNNSGKTVLLGALGNEKLGGAHRSPKTVAKPAPIVPAKNVTKFWIQYSFTPNEILAIIRQHTDQLLIHEFPGVLNGPHLDYEKLAGLFAQVLELRLHFRDNKPVAIELPQFGTICDIVLSGQVKIIRISLKPDASIDDSRQPSAYMTTVDDKLCWRILVSHVMKSAYMFRAVRTISEKASGAAVRMLQSNASNLPQVLRTLDGDDRGLYRKYLRAIRSVFPEIRELRLRAVSGSEVEILVEFIDPIEERSELAVPLYQCGMGLGQAMAILYVVVTHTDSQIVLIDEPHSFLHPSAIRNLLKVCQEHSHHQYVFATHSPTAISAAREKTILHVERKDMCSGVRTLNSNDTEALGEAFRSLGLRPSDFLAVDAIVWVEGATEKRCFPLIIEAFGFHIEGVRFIPIAEIGDTTGKSARKFIALLERVAKDVGLLPREIMCVADGDKAKDLVNANTNRDVQLKTLSRQNFESYFLDFPAILETVLKENAAEGSPIHEGKYVREWMIENNGGHELDDEAWLKNADGANFIHSMFNCLGNIDYKRNKPVYGEEITRRILTENPDHFQEIVDLIKDILERELQPEST